MVATSELQEDIQALQRQLAKAIQDDSETVVLSKAQVASLLDRLAAAQNELQTSEAKARDEISYFRQMETAVPYGVWIADAQGVVYYVSQSFLDLLGMTQEEACHSAWANRLVHEDRERVLAAWRHCRETGEFLDTEGRIVDADGDIHTVLFRGSPILDETGKVLGWLGVNLDLTKYKLAEKEVEEAARAKWEEQVRVHAEAQTRSRKELDQITYVFSHDLQEPLRMVASYVGLLEREYRDKLTPEAREFIAFAVEGAQRIQKLIRDLLDFSYITSRGQSFAWTPAEAILGRALHSVRSKINETGARITHDPLPVVWADGPQLVRVFYHLIDNAIKFRQQDQPPCIHIGAEKRGSEWVFSIRDNGIGIEPQYLERIFGIFQRLHLRREYPGTGMGLTLARQIVERHGGQLTVESTLGQGTTFFFTIPIKDAQARILDHLTGSVEATSPKRHGEESATRQSGVLTPIHVCHISYAGRFSIDPSSQKPKATIGVLFSVGRHRRDTFDVFALSWISPTGGHTIE